MADRGAERWRLVREGRVLAELVLVGVDMPWRLCRVEQVLDRGFEEVRSATVAAERAMAAGEHDEAVRLMAGIRELGLGVCPEGAEDPIREFLLWFDGDIARLRY